MLRRTHHHHKEKLLIAQEMGGDKGSQVTPVRVRTTRRAHAACARADLKLIFPPPTNHMTWQRPQSLSAGLLLFFFFASADNLRGVW